MSAIAENLKNIKMIKDEDSNNRVYLELDGDQMLVFIIQGYRYNFTTRNLGEPGNIRWLGEVLYKQYQRVALKAKRTLAKDLKELEDARDNFLQGYF